MTREAPTKAKGRPTRAMVLAAGLGTRLKPITDTVPKPLIPIDGRALIDHALDRLEATGVTEVAVNTHHLADQVEAHLKNRESPGITFSPEPELLDTGGGVAKALPLLGPAP
ncbi:MAG: sugar phosphate nucleotidyltransferase, partial [Rhodospirillales bacterium]